MPAQEASSCSACRSTPWPHTYPELKELTSAHCKVLLPNLFNVQLGEHKSRARGKTGSASRRLHPVLSKPLLAGSVHPDPGLPTASVPLCPLQTSSLLRELSEGGTREGAGRPTGRAPRTEPLLLVPTPHRSATPGTEANLKLNTHRRLGQCLFILVPSTPPQHPFQESGSSSPQD